MENQIAQINQMSDVVMTSVHALQRRSGERVSVHDERCCDDKCTCAAEEVRGKGECPLRVSYYRCMAQQASFSNLITGA